MDEPPKDERGGLKWVRGENDPRANRTLERRGEFWSYVMLAGLTAVLLVGFLYTELHSFFKLFLLFFVVGWILTVAYSLDQWMLRRRVSMEVRTIVDLPPKETMDLLEKALVREGIEHKRVDMWPWVHGEQARFRVRMDQGVEALIVLAYLLLPSMKGPTIVVLRSSQRRDEWLDLRSVINKTFTNLPPMAPVRGASTLIGPTTDDVSIWAILVMTLFVAFFFVVFVLGIVYSISAGILTIILVGGGAPLLLFCLYIVGKLNAR